MQIRLTRHAALVLLVLMAISVCFVDANAQRRRNKRSRRVTNPVTRVPDTRPAPAQTSEPRIISTSDDAANDLNGDQMTDETRATRRRSGTSGTNQDMTQDSLNKLSGKVTRLTQRVGQIEDQQHSLLDMQRLAIAEQRLARIEEHAEKLRTQLNDVMEKQDTLQKRAVQIDFDLQPENIERALAGVGTTHPEDLREQRRRQLETEKTSVRTQLDRLATERTRLEQAISSAEAEADHIRQFLDSAATTTSSPNATQSNTTNTNNNNSVEAPTIITQPPPQTPTQTQSTTPSNPPR